MHEHDDFFGLRRDEVEDAPDLLLVVGRLTVIAELQGLKEGGAVTRFAGQQVEPGSYIGPPRLSIRRRA
jgi:hypothetical protein